MIKYSSLDFVDISISDHRDDAFLRNLKPESAQLDEFVMKTIQNLPI
jgi:hypothetical protein